MSVYNTQEIMEILPHRHPFLLIDTIEELEEYLPILDEVLTMVDEKFCDR